MPKMNLTTIKAKSFKQRCYIDYYERERQGENEDRAKKCIVNHPFNEKLEVLLPKNDCHTQNIIDGLSGSASPGSSFYTVAPLKAFVIDGEFRKYIGNRSDLIALSHGRIDQDDVFAIVNGKLYLSMTRQTYERAGLQGEPPRGSSDSNKRKRRRRRSKGTTGATRGRNHYMVTFNLLSPKLIPGKPGFERLVWSLENTPLRHPVPWTICASDCTDPNTCSNSDSLELILAKCFEKYPFKSVPSQLKISNIGPVKRAGFSNPKQQTNHSLEISKTTKTEIFTEWAMELHEYLAMVSMNADRIRQSDNVGPSISTYQPPPLDTDHQQQESSSSDSFVKLSWQGGIIPRWFISDVEDVLRSKADMYALTCFGFQNAPLSWKEQLHSGITMFDNLYTVLQLPYSSSNQQQQQLVLYQIVGDCDAH